MGGLPLTPQIRPPPETVAEKCGSPRITAEDARPANSSIAIHSELRRRLAPVTPELTAQLRFWNRRVVDNEQRMALNGRSAHLFNLQVLGYRMTP